MGRVFGASHLCIACGDISARHAKRYSSEYTVKFSEQDVPNPAAKLPFLRHQVELHGMMFLTAPQRLSLELLQRCSGGIAERLGYQPVVEVAGDVFDTLDASVNEACGHLAALLSQPVRLMGSGAFRRFAVRAEGAPGGIRALALACADVPAGAEFWEQGLGLSLGPKAAGGAYLSLRAISASWGVTLLLHPVQDPISCADPGMFLDDEGPNCLSFFTREHEQWRGQRLQHGAKDHGSPFGIHAGGKDLHAVFLRGPNGELVELLDYA